MLKSFSLSNVLRGNKWFLGFLILSVLWVQFEVATHAHGDGEEETHSCEYVHHNEHYDEHGLWEFKPWAFDLNLLSVAKYSFVYERPFNTYPSPRGPPLIS